MAGHVMSSSRASSFNTHSAALELEVIALLLKGHGMRRRRLIIDDLYPSSTVCRLKQSVQDRLDDMPSTVQLCLDGDATDAIPDTATLADCQVRSGTQLMVLVHYETPGDSEALAPKTSAESPSEEGELETTLDGLGGVGDLTPCPLDSEASSAADTDSDPPSFAALPPPLLLQQGLKEKSASRCLWSEDEVKDIQDDRLFELSVDGWVFMTHRTRVRHCALPVSAETTVAEVRARVEMWLGARAAELTLLSGPVLLEDEGTLGNHEIGRGARILAMASF